MRKTVIFVFSSRTLEPSAPKHVEKHSLVRTARRTGLFFCGGGSCHLRIAVALEATGVVVVVAVVVSVSVRVRQR